MCKSLALAFRCIASLICFSSVAGGAKTAEGSRLLTSTNVLSVKRIWHTGRHNAFTDLIRFKDQWFCTFRESQAHVGGNGKIRVLSSKDGENWDSGAVLSEAGMDLRDPKLSITPKGELMLTLGGSVYEGKVLKERQSRVAFSRDGSHWSAPHRVLEKGDWLWRVTWHKDRGYGIAYSNAAKGAVTNKPGMVARLFSTRNGVDYELVKELNVSGSPNEATVRFLPNDDCVALVRREAGDQQAWIGMSHPPYQEWQWHPAGMRVGGPNFIIENGTMLVSGRQHGKTAKDVKTFVGTMTLDKVEPQLTLPSGGDCSYPGLVFKDGMLWVSYYSSHEGSTDIYLAKILCSEVSAGAVGSR